MKNLLVIFLLSSIVIGCKTEDTSPVITQEFSLGEFTSINLAMACDVIIREGSIQKVEITGPTETLNQINKSVNSGHWQIELPNNHFKSYKNLTITITSNAIEDIAVSGSGIVSCNHALNLKSISIAGSGGVAAETDSKSLKCSISGSGNISVSGSTESLEQRISGSGSFSGFDLVARSTEIHISGSGSSKTYTMDNLEASISGSGSVYYKGNPSVEQRVSGSGSVIEAN
ncbi:MAG: DUF2807 domain-containing protein [Bacteroidia bacterium]